MADVSKLNIHGTIYDLKDAEARSELSEKADIDQIPTLTSQLVNDSNFINNSELILALADKQDKLTAGNNININNNVISAQDTTYTNATSSTSGLMSSSDKTKLDNINLSGIAKIINNSGSWTKSKTFNVSGYSNGFIIGHGGSGSYVVTYINSTYVDLAINSTGMNVSASISNGVITITTSNTAVCNGIFY